MKEITKGLFKGGNDTKFFNVPEIGCKVENPIVQILVKHLKVESEIFKTKNDIYSLNWAVFALISANKVKESIVESTIYALESESERIISNEVSLTTELVIKFALGERILKCKGRENPKVTKAMETLLEKSKNKHWFNSQETVSMLLFLLSNTNKFSSELDIAYNWLYNKYNQFVEDKNYPNIIDSSLGMLSYNNQIKVPFEELIKNLDHQSIERISKFSFCLIKSGRTDYLRDVIPLLERKLNDKFEDWVFPNLEMCLFEGISLINSDIKKEDVQVILDNLRENNEEWANSVNIGDTGLTLRNIGGITKIPFLNVKEDVLSLLILLEAGRKTIYQLNEKEYELTNKAIRGHKDGYTGIKENNFECFFYFSLALITISFIFAFYALNGFQSIMELSQLELSWSLKNIAILLKSSGSTILLVIFVLFIVFYYRIFYRLRLEGEIKSKKELLLLFPIIKELHSLIKGDR